MASRGDGHSGGFFLPSSHLISSHLSPEVRDVLQGQGCSSQQQQSMISKSESKSRCSKGCASPGAQEGTSSSCPMRITPLHTRLLAHQLHHKLCANLVCEVPEIFGKGEGTTTARHCHFFFFFCYATLYQQFLPELIEYGRQLEFV